MHKFIDFTAETVNEKYAMLAGRMEAFASYVAQQKYNIEREVCAAMLGFELPDESREEADHEIRVDKMCIKIDGVEFGEQTRKDESYAQRGTDIGKNWLLITNI